MIPLEQLVGDFAVGIKTADACCPQAVNARSKVTFRPGIGPHSEARTIALIGAELEALAPSSYGGKLQYGVPYPNAPRQKCDLCLGDNGAFE
jgi:hypothetical protein